ncbi:MAG: methyltransferase domain-containing protein [Anaerolineaceae bacterium]|nr:methyltransferase domain-containing protein [Anaerolineaceae bacterium]
MGADECQLRPYLKNTSSYTGIGLGGHPDLRINLEKEDIPFDNDSFDCVLYLDVLEHVVNIHHAFDDLCRVSKNYVIISLPNPWADMYEVLCHQDYQPGMPFKFYGLPVEPVEDRHKWFFLLKKRKKLSNIGLQKWVRKFYKWILTKLRMNEDASKSISVTLPAPSCFDRI